MADLVTLQNFSSTYHQQPQDTSDTQSMTFPALPDQTEYANDGFLCSLTSELNTKNIESFIKYMKATLSEDPSFDTSQATHNGSYPQGTGYNQVPAMQPVPSSGYQVPSADHRYYHTGGYSTAEPGQTQPSYYYNEHYNTFQHLQGYGNTALANTGSHMTSIGSTAHSSHSNASSTYSTASTNSTSGSPSGMNTAGKPSLQDMDAEKNARRARRKRTNFTQEQLESLEDIFKEEKYPDVYRRDEIASQLDLKEEVVRVWFKNRRAKVKRESDSRSSTPKATSPSYSDTADCVLSKTAGGQPKTTMHYKNCSPAPSSNGVPRAFHPLHTSSPIPNFQSYTRMSPTSFSTQGLNPHFQSISSPMTSNQMCMKDNVITSMAGNLHKPDFASSAHSAHSVYHQYSGSL